MLAARIRERLGRVQFAGDSVGATIGIAIYPVDGTTANQILTRADEDLMNGKLLPSVAGGERAPEASPAASTAVGAPLPRPETA